MDHHEAATGHDHQISPYPSHHTKILHLVRHAQGIHNVQSAKNHEALFSYEYFDAHLSPLGWNQVDSLLKHVLANGLSTKIDLVITSCLLRSMQTAVGVFGGEAHTNEVGKSTGHSAITSLNSPPFIALDLCRERLGVQPCNKRKCVSEYQSLFPAIDFSLIESDEDILWKPDVRETTEELAARGLKFFKNWLWTRKEKEIAIVTHDRFLSYSLNAISTDWHPSVKTEICKGFTNCELRSVVITYDTNRSNLMGFNYSSSTY